MIQNVARLRVLTSALCLAVLVALVASPRAQAQVGTDQPPPKSLMFSDTAYQLVYQANPMPGYTQSAYLPQGEKLPYYHTMLMSEWLVTGVSLEDAVDAQIDTIETRRDNGDLTVNYALIENEDTGEYLLDFVMSSTDAKVGHIVEWNAYRYIPFVDADEEEGVQIYGYSARGYGADGGREFLLGLDERRAQILQTLTEAKVPTLGKP